MFFCPSSPQFIWELNDVTHLQIAIVFMSIVCPATVLLNILVILAVKTRSELRKNSNIQLSSLAAADLLVGAVSMPLTISLDTLVISRHLVEDVLCTIGYVTAFLLFTACSASCFHLLAIAWERYVAVQKWRDYKVIATKGRIKINLIISWLAALLTVGPMVIMHAAGVPYEIVVVVDVVSSIFSIFSLLLISYYYVMVYRGLRRFSRGTLSEVKTLKLQTKVANTTLWLTFFVGIFCAPTLVVYLFGGIVSFLRTSSFIRWSEIFLQLNSLANPLLYCYRDRFLKNAIMEMLWIRKPTRKIQPAVRVRRFHRKSIALLEFAGQLQNGEDNQRLRSKNPTEEI